MTIKKLDIETIRRHGFRKATIYSTGADEVPALITDRAIDHEELEAVYPGFHVYDLISQNGHEEPYTFAAPDAQEFIGKDTDAFEHTGTMLTADIIESSSNRENYIDLTDEDYWFALTDEYMTIDTYIEITSEGFPKYLGRALEYLREEVAPLYQDIIARDPVKGLIYAITDLMHCASDVHLNDEDYASWEAVLTRPSKADAPLHQNETDKAYADLLESLKPEIKEER